MQHNQTLNDITATVLKNIESILDDFLPDIVLVQGDTTTAMAGTLAAYYKKIKTGHIEAGLRSGNNYSPFPEEVNRKIIGAMAYYHFAPTQQAKTNLFRENITAHVFVTGNTVIDALLWGVEKVRTSDGIKGDFDYLDFTKRIVLITAHRRESFGKPFINICNALLEIAQTNPEVQIVYPVHLNPNVQEVVYPILGNQPNIHLIKPLGYPQLLWIMDKSFIVITDSGGIQEEAPALGKPVLVMRDVTERGEGIEAGTALLVGTEKDTIVSQTQRLLDDKEAYEKMAKAVNPYGDGTSALQIVSILLNN